MKPRWYLDRLLAMSPAEVVHRVRQTLPRRGWRSTGRFAPRFRPPVVRDDALADAIVAGYRDVLGLGRVRVPQRFADPRLEYELHRGHAWVAVAAVPHHREWLARELAAWQPIWDSPMEVAIRIHSLLAVATLTELPICAPMIAEHVRWLEPRLSAYSSANNHLVVELSALVAAARAFGESPPLDALRAAVDAQVFADGVHAEMATHYHAFVLEALGLVAASERAFGLTHAWLDQVIAAMTAYLAVLRCGDGSLLQQGDDDGGRILTGASLPAAGTESQVFRDSGQVIWRSPRLHVAFDAGPFGFGTLAAHAHCDALAIYVAIDGLPFLVDRGTYLYADELRDSFRATAAHNTLQIAALEQAQAAGPFLWKRKPRVMLEHCEPDRAVASHDGFAPFTHRRTLEHRGEVLHVTDHANTALPITTRFHFPPGLEVALHGARAETERGWIEFEGAGSLVTTLHSAQYAQLTTATTLEVRGLVEIKCSIGPP